jgi:O-antigen biosynthesis protein
MSCKSAERRGLRRAVSFPYHRPAVPVIGLRSVGDNMRLWIHRHPRLRRQTRWVIRQASDWVPGLAALLAELGNGRNTISQATYGRWVREHDTLDAAALARIGAMVGQLPVAPIISVVMPTYEPSEPHLREAIASVQTQIYPHWQLCIADDASPSPHVWPVLEQAQVADPRVVVTRRARNGHISAASNTALALAKGDFVALLDHDDILPVHALAFVAAAIAAFPTVDVLFSDEDKIDDRGVRSDPYFKPGWNPELLLTQNLVSHLGVYRRSLLKRIGGFREGFEGSQDWDLALRATDAVGPGQVRHIPAVLYHWRRDRQSNSFSAGSAEHCAAAGRQAVAEALERHGAAGAIVVPQPMLPGWSRVVYASPAAGQTVSVLAPGADGAQPSDASVEWITPGPDLALMPGQSLGNWLNRAAARAKGEVLVILGPNLRPADDGWLRELSSQALRPRVGAVGGMVVNAKGIVLQAGCLLDLPGQPSHAVAEVPYLAGSLSRDIGYYGHLRLPRNVSATRGQLLAIRHGLWREMGGLDATTFPQSLWGVDLCLRLREGGYRIVWTPFAKAIAVDTTLPATKDEPTGDEAVQLQEKWNGTEEPFFNPSLERAGPGLRLAGGPRMIKELGMTEEIEGHLAFPRTTECTSVRQALLIPENPPAPPNNARHSI